MLESVLAGLGGLSFNQGAKDDDAVDQIHHFVSVGLFLFFAAAVGAKQYVGDPIHCWVPAEFKDSHQEYSENFCFINHMYRVPWEEPMPYEIEDRFRRDISFYRWVPVIFLFMAMMFKFPNLLWTELKSYSGINIQKMVDMAEETVLTPEDERQDKIESMGYFIDRWLRTYRVYKYNAFVRAREKISGVFCFVMGKRHGTYLTGLYLFTKFLNCVNVVSQFFILSSFLGIDFFAYGFNVISHLESNGEFKDFHNFPRVVFCDFEIRQLQNIQRFTLQCVLSINLFTEKMFAVTWFWLFILAIFTFLNFGKWIYNIFFRSRREQFINKYLGMLQLKPGTGEQKLFKQFVGDYLRDDGVFVLRSISINTNPILTFDLVSELWRRFKELHESDEDKPMINS